MANIKMSEYICLAILIGNLTPDSRAKMVCSLHYCQQLESNSSMIQANEPVIGPARVDTRILQCVGER